MPWDGEEEVSGMEGKEGSDRSDREEQLDVKAEQVFSIYLIFLWVALFLLWTSLNAISYI